MKHWAYWSRYICINRYMDAPNDTYKRLLELVKNKDYFVLTTNVDHQFQKAGFDKHRLFYTQGDYGWLQCSEPCHDKTYDNEEVIRRMVAEQKNMRIPSELVPKCPKCGKPMTMNLRCDNTFVQDEAGIKQVSGTVMFDAVTRVCIFCFWSSAWDSIRLSLSNIRSGR